LSCYSRLIADAAVQVRDGKAVYHVRAALLAAGFPNTTAASCVNRFCSSSLQATQNIANEIASGAVDVGLAVGAESLSFSGDRLDRPFVDEILDASQEARDCMQSMGQTSETVAHDFNVTREMQDRYAAESYARAETAQRSGWFDDEIVPITVKRDGKDVTLTRDEGPRWGTTFEKLSKLRPSFSEFGDRSTAGNSSQITDGAAAVLLMKRSKALELNQPILAKYVGATVAGLAPRIMGIGPVIAIPKLLGKYNLSLDDIDLIEINEAFASMAVYCRDELKIDWNKLNVRGGAIALGHPFGCTGIRQIVTGLSECRRRRVKVLLTSMCLGTGMGMAGLFVNEQNVLAERSRL
jgi:acetyl-CoA acyltransferase 1